MKITDTMVLFWGSDSPFSNWHPAEFTLGEHHYVNTEQYMMAAKARIFQAPDIEARIMAERDPGEMKALGRAIRGFSEEVWVPRRNKVMFDGCLAKFTQNPQLGRVLLNTGNRHLVEASPVDAIWGIKLGANDPRALDATQWRGLNLLGSALMRVRTELQILNPPGTQAPML